MPEPPGRTRYLSLDEITILFKHCSDQIRPVVETALNTGMRLQEILGLTWDCIFIENTINPYLEIIITKNGEKRYVPLNDTMINLFEELKESANGLSTVFTNINGEPLRSVRHQFEHVLKEAKISDFRFHDLRHTFASHYVMNGGDLLSLKEILGHSTMKMVARYAHLSPSHKQKMVNNLNFSDKNCHLSVTGQKEVSTL